MYNKTLEEVLPKATSTISEMRDSMLNEDRTKIKKEFNGYLASFGPSVIMAGLRQTAGFYDNAKKKNTLGVINNIIFDVIRRMDWHDGSADLEHYVASDDKLRKKRVLSVVTACKIAIRTFDLEE